MPLGRFRLLPNHFHLQCFWMFLRKLQSFRNIGRLIPAMMFPKSPDHLSGGSESPRILGAWWGWGRFPRRLRAGSCGRCAPLENGWPLATRALPALGRAFRPRLLRLWSCLPQALTRLSAHWPVFPVTNRRMMPGLGSGDLDSRSGVHLAKCWTSPGKPPPLCSSFAIDGMRFTNSPRYAV